MPCLMLMAPPKNCEKHSRNSLLRYYCKTQDGGSDTASPTLLRGRNRKASIMPWQAAPSLIIIIGAFNVAAGLVWSVDRLYYGKVCVCVYRKKK